MKLLRLSLPLLSLCLNACSPVNSEFSCNKTTGDSCLTIEQVDSMTHFADDPIITKKVVNTADFYLSQSDSAVWIARIRHNHASDV